MTEETKADIGCACVVGFIALLGLFGWVASENKRACETIEQYDATEFRAPPTEAIQPEHGAVAIYWDGMNTVIDQTTWKARTSDKGGKMDDQGITEDTWEELSDNKGKDDPDE